LIAAGLNVKRITRDDFRPVKCFLAKFAYIGPGIAVYSFVLAQC